MRDRRRSSIRIACALGIAILTGAIGDWLLTTLPRPALQPPPTVEIPFTTASIDEINDRRASAVALFRLDVDPAVLVLDFPDLHAQGQMLNRIAALIEKADEPRERVVTEAELDAHIRASGGTPDSYYYGHDYRAADLARFFRLAADEGLALNPYEAWLKDRLSHEGWFQGDATGALISIPGISADIDASSRTTIFRHELSHAVYFTDPAYVSLTRHLWNDLLTEKERATIRNFLGTAGYDMTDEDLMANEGQAYLINTHDPRYFLPAMVGIDAVRETILRSTFIEAIPEPWLRSSALAVAPIAETAATAPIGWVKPVDNVAAAPDPAAPPTAGPWSSRGRPPQPDHPADAGPQSPRRAPE